MRTVQFLPAALRDFDGLDRTTQQRVIAALERYAATGHGDVKRLQASASGVCSSTSTHPELSW